MKTILNTFLIWLLTFSFVSCSLDNVTVVEPDRWQKQQFEKSVRQAVRKAVQTPGIDNGSTLVVTSQGDTLITPVDSLMRAMPNRTVYVEIQSPEYPQGITRNFAEKISLLTIVVLICILLMTIIILVFLTLMRRLGSRNKLISKAIDSNYPLPESFYTGQPKQAPTKITQLFTRGYHKLEDEQSQNFNNEKAPVEEQTYETSIKESLKRMIPNSKDKAIQLRNSFILIGLGIVIFVSFASNGEASVGFFVGGTFLVFGLAKLLSYIFTKNL